MSETVSKNEVLRLENITMQFGGVVAINNLSLQVNLRFFLIIIITPIFVTCGCSTITPSSAVIFKHTIFYTFR